MAAPYFTKAEQQARDQETKSLISAANEGFRLFSNPAAADAEFTANPPAADVLFKYTDPTESKADFYRRASDNTTQILKQESLTASDKSQNGVAPGDTGLVTGDQVNKVTALNKFKNDQQIFGITPDLTTPVGTFTGYINANGSLTANSGWTTKFYTISTGDISVLTGILSNPTVGIPFVFWNNVTDKTVIEKASIGSYVEGSTYTYCPEGATILAITHALVKNQIATNSKISQLETNQTNLTDRTAQVENTVEPIVEILNIQENESTIPLTPVYRYEDSYLNNNATVVELAGRYVDVFAVSEGQKVNIKGTSATAGRAWGTGSSYSTTERSYTKVGQSVLVSSGQDFEELFIVPAGVNFILCTRAIQVFPFLKESELLKPLANVVNADGDSLTQGAGGTPYTTFLGTLLGENWTIINRGVGGEKTISIGARQGGMPAYIRDSIVIKADTTTTQIPTWDDNGTTRIGLLSSYNDQETALLLQGNGGLNPCYVQGIECTISYSGGNYFIKRNEIGDRDITTAPKSLITSYAASQRNGVNILFMGQNGGFDGTGTDLTAQYLKLTKFKGDGKYLIVTSAINGSASMTAPITAEYGLRHINLKEYYSLYAIYDAIARGYLPSEGYPTAQDLTDMSNQLPPASLRANSGADPVHFNSIGYQLLADLIYNRGVQLNFWQ